MKFLGKDIDSGNFWAVASFLIVFLLWSGYETFQSGQELDSDVKRGFYGLVVNKRDLKRDMYSLSVIDKSGTKRDFTFVLKNEDFNKVNIGDSVSKVADSKQVDLYSASTRNYCCKLSLFYYAL
jgi:hypothetical protein